MKLSWILTTITLLLALTGCKAYEEKKETQLLENRVKTFGQALRWGHMQDAYGYIKLPEGEKIELPKDIDNIRVTHYEDFIPVYQISETKAFATHKIDYVLMDRQVVKSITDEQIWEFFEDEKNWFRTNPMPKFE
ncbi:MAG: hypothetical protein ACWA5Q_08490 [bacterium]